MINALNDLRLKWRAKQKELLAEGRTRAGQARLNHQITAAVYDACVMDLIDTVDGVKPLPLNEASTEKLYKWAPRMITIFDLMIEARDRCTDEPEAAIIAGRFADLTDRAFLNDLYDLFKQISNRSQP